MTVEEKRNELGEYCRGLQFSDGSCENCRIKPYCVPEQDFSESSDDDICRWFEMTFGEDAEQQEDQKMKEDIASAIVNMKWELIEKAFGSLDASRNYSVESEEHRVRMDVVKQACICLEILSRCEKTERKCSHADN